MASKGGKGGGQAQSVFGPRGGGMSGGGIFDMLRQQFPQMMPQQQQPQFAPVPPPMQTPGQQFTPFNGEPMTRTADQNPQLPGQPQGTPFHGTPNPGFAPFNPSIGVGPGQQGTTMLPAFVPPPGSQFPSQGGGQQFAPQGQPLNGDGGQQFPQVPRKMMPNPRSPLGPLVGGRKGAF